MRILSLAFAVVLCAGLVWAQADKFILDVELRVKSVDAENQKVTLVDAASNTPYQGVVDKKTKFKAKKKVFRGKLKLKDLKNGDLVRVKMDPADSRLLEVQLLERGGES